MGVRMATMDAIERIKGVPFLETAKEVDSSELNDEGHYPKFFKVIYSTDAFHGKVGKLSEKNFTSLQSAKSSPFPTDDKYVLATIQVFGGWYTRSSDKEEWIFKKAN
jgi:hypothetical protein